MSSVRRESTAVYRFAQFGLCDLCALAVLSAINGLRWCLSHTREYRWRYHPRLD